MMVKLKMMAIAPYEGLRQLIMNYAQKQDIFDVTAVVANFREGMEFAMRSEREGYDVVLSRGGTAEYIEGTLSIPVVHVGVSSFDMLRVLKLADGYSGHAAIVGFPDIVSSARAVCELIDLKMDSFVINNEEEATGTVQRLYSQSYSLIIGDVMSTDAAGRASTNTILITSGEESVAVAFDFAAKTCRQIRKYARKNLLYEELIQHSGQEVFCFDQEKKQVYPAAGGTRTRPGRWDGIIQQVLHNGSYSGIQQDKESLTKLTGKAFQLGEKQYAAVYSQRLEGVSAQRNSAIKVFHRRHGFLKDIFTQSGFYPKNTLDRARVFADQHKTILLTGATGTGKDHLAWDIHWQRHGGEAPMICVDFELMREEDFSRVLDTLEKILAESEAGTVYFRQIDRAPVEMLLPLNRMIQESRLSNKFMVLSSAAKNLRTIYRGDEDTGILYELFAQLTLPIPPLRERREEIPNICSLILNEINVKYGKQIVGIEPEAMEHLQKYDWPGNIAQLKRVLEQAGLFSGKPMLGKSAVEEALDSFEIQKEFSAFSPDLSKTLDEITGDIIQYVLQEEDMNIGRATQRLGISRSTLWRKSKSWKE